MKKLILVRHAKSSWKDASLTDFQRPLKKRGRKDALLMGRYLAQQGEKPDRILSSPAVRARETVEILAREIGYPLDEIGYVENLYLASVRTLLGIIRTLDDDLTHIMLVGHNPGLTELANHFAPRPIANVPTCGVVTFHFDIDAWRWVDPGLVVHFAFDYPKKFRP